jgi:restriction system protein
LSRKNGLPPYPELVFPTLTAVKNRGGSATIEEVEDGVSELMKLSQEVLDIPHLNTGKSEFQYKLAWVRTYLKKFGALQNSGRGVWSVTGLGEKLSEAEAKNVFRFIQKQKKDKPSERDSSLDEIVNDEEQDWSTKLLSTLGSIEPSGFERLCQRLLRESGFIKVEVTGRPSDGGIDGIGVLRMNLVSFQVLFQCKRWKGSLGSSVVRDFRGAMVGRADKGLIITTGTFTSEARKEATRDGAPAIDLIDGENLCILLKERQLGLVVTQVEQVTVDEQFFKSM